MRIFSIPFNDKNMGKVAIYFSFIFIITLISCKQSKDKELIDVSFSPTYVLPSSLSINHDGALIVTGTTNSYSEKFGYKTIFHFNIEDSSVEYSPSPASGYNPELFALDNGKNVEMFYGPRSDKDETEIVYFREKSKWLANENELGVGNRLRSINSEVIGDKLYSCMYARGNRVGELLCYKDRKVLWRKEIKIGSETTLPSKVDASEDGILVCGKLDLPHNNDGHDYETENIRSFMIYFDNEGKTKWMQRLEKDGQMLIEDMTVHDKKIVSISTVIMDTITNSDILISTCSLEDGQVNEEKVMYLPRSQQGRFIEYYNGKYYVIVLDEDDKSGMQQSYIWVLNDSFDIESIVKLSSNDYSEKIADCIMYENKLFILTQLQKCRNCDISSMLIRYDLESGAIDLPVAEINASQLKNRA